MGRRRGTGRLPTDAPSLEAGFVAGAEALILGVLVFVFGTLAILNGWAVLDAKFATNAAAREAVRAIVDAEPDVGADALRARAAGAAGEAAGVHGYDVEVVDVEHLSALPPGRCDPVRVRAVITVTSTIVPGVAGPATFRVGSEHEELMHPFRSGFEGEADCAF